MFTSALSLKKCSSCCSQTRQLIGLVAYRGGDSPQLVEEMVEEQESERLSVVKAANFYRFLFFVFLRFCRSQLSAGGEQTTVTCGGVTPEK